MLWATVRIALAFLNCTNRPGCPVPAWRALAPNQACAVFAVQVNCKQLPDRFSLRKHRGLK